jgi:hypothetical protein
MAGLYPTTLSRSEYFGITAIRLGRRKQASYLELRYFMLMHHRVVVLCVSEYGRYRHEAGIEPATRGYQPQLAQSRFFNHEAGFSAMKKAFRPLEKD